MPTGAGGVDHVSSASQSTGPCVSATAMSVASRDIPVARSRVRLQSSRSILHAMFRSHAVASSCSGPQETGSRFATSAVNEFIISVLTARLCIPCVAPTVSHETPNTPTVLYPIHDDRDSSGATSSAITGSFGPSAPPAKFNPLSETGMQLEAHAYRSPFNYRRDYTNHRPIELLLDSL